MFVMLIMGCGGLTLSYWLLRGLKPIYHDNGQIKLHETWVNILRN